MNGDSVLRVALAELHAEIGDDLEAPPRVAFSLTELGEACESLGVRRPLLVMDRRALASARLEHVIEQQLGDRACTTFDRFSPNPTCEQAAAAAETARVHAADGVVAVGGGSCCDVAKVAALAASAPDIAGELARGISTERGRPLPLIAASTTAGTGSEATHFAAIYVDGRKVSVAHPGLLPRVAILDVRFHRAMPPHIAAQTGLDALGQALESTWAVGANEQSLRFAAAAGRRIAGSLAESVRSGDDEARVAMMIGAHLAGRAINISKTTASHALSYQLTQRFDLAHGHAVALTLGHLASANARAADDRCCDPRGVLEARRRVDDAAGYLGVTPEDLPRVVQDLLEQVALPATLEEAGVQRDALRSLAESIDPIRLSNNPFRLGTDDLERMLQDAWQGVPDKGKSFTRPVRVPIH